MKNVIVFLTSPSTNRPLLTRYFRAQIDNSLEFGWSVSDIILASDMPFSYRGVTNIDLEIPREYYKATCKAYAILKLFQSGIDDVLWVHDHDAWQNAEFANPLKPGTCVGLTPYACKAFEHRPYNGATQFWTPQSQDLLPVLLQKLKAAEYVCEEFSLAELCHENRDRFTIIDPTFSISVASFDERYEKAEKPIKVLHVKPEVFGLWEFMFCGINENGIKPASSKLTGIIKKEFRGSPFEGTVCIGVSPDPSVCDWLTRFFDLQPDCRSIPHALPCSFSPADLNENLLHMRCAFDETIRFAYSGSPGHLPHVFEILKQEPNAKVIGVLGEDKYDRALLALEKRYPDNVLIVDSLSPKIQSEILRAIGCKGRDLLPELRVERVPYDFDILYGYVFRPNDTLSKLFGSDWEVVYYSPINESFRKRWPNPNMVGMGDSILFPPY
jgi:hypothetical protein